MSTDPKAILYYGIDLGGVIREKHMSATYEYHDINDEWEEAHRPAEPEGDRAAGYHLRPEWDAWREKLRAYEATVEHVEMTWFGAENCERYVIHCPALEIKVEWDEQHEFERGHLLCPNPEADKWIEKFCEQFGLPFKRPAWHLAAHYF